MKILLPLLLLASTGTVFAKLPAEFGDLAKLRLFASVSPAALRGIFDDPDSLGVRKVRDMGALLKRFKGDGHESGGEEAESWSAGAYTRAYFQLEAASAWYSPATSTAVDRFEVRATPTEGDDRNPPVLTFLKLGASWVLLPSYACGNGCGTPFVAKDVKSNAVAFVKTHHAYSGGVGRIHTSGLEIALDAVKGPSITAIGEWPGLRKIRFKINSSQCHEAGGTVRRSARSAWQYCDGGQDGRNGQQVDDFEVISSAECLEEGGEVKAEREASPAVTRTCHGGGENVDGRIVAD